MNNFDDQLELNRRSRDNLNIRYSQKSLPIFQQQGRLKSIAQVHFDADSKEDDEPLVNLIGDLRLDEGDKLKPLSSKSKVFAKKNDKTNKKMRPMSPGEKDPIDMLADLKDFDEEGSTLSAEIKYQVLCQRMKHKEDMLHVANEGALDEGHQVRKQPESPPSAYYDNGYEKELKTHR